MKAALRQANVVDIHAHAVLRETLGAAGSYGPEIGANEEGKPWFRIGEYYLRNVRYEGGAFMEPDVRIAAMDRAGIDYQVLSPNPLTYFHHVEPALALPFCRRHNDALAALVARHPTRLGALAALHGCRPEQVFVGNGSDEVLALCTRAFVEDDGEGFTKIVAFLENLKVI